MSLSVRILIAADTAVRVKGETKNTLKRKGKAKVEATVTYTPQNGDPAIVANTDTKTVKLIKR